MWWNEWKLGVGHKIFAVLLLKNEEGRLSEASLQEREEGQRGCWGNPTTNSLSYKYSSVPPIVSLNPDNKAELLLGTIGA